MHILILEAANMTRSLHDIACEIIGDWFPVYFGAVPLFFEEGPARIARSIAAQFPPCEACDGRGYLYPEGELP
jgi:hypothetical protein